MTAPTLTEALAAAGFEPDSNVCAGCHHKGGDHDLGNHCLICGDYFASMTEPEQWAYGIAALPPDLLAAVELGTAWQVCEAALPRRWRFSLAPYYPNGWEAEAHDITRVWRPENRKYATGTTGPYDTPAAALRALEAALRERKP